MNSGSVQPSIHKKRLRAFGINKHTLPVWRNIYNTARGNRKDNLLKLRANYRMWVERLLLYAVLHSCWIWLTLISICICTDRNVLDHLWQWGGGALLRNMPTQKSRKRLLLQVSQWAWCKNDHNSCCWLHVLMSKCLPLRSSEHLVKLFSFFLLFFFFFAF